ncbi:TPA: hypothetical protein DEP26_01445 [Candidatus Uhrbacteria bacterium]|nr:hypothetical protein [Candidatus Uhrbacteria bacterium]
MPSLYGEGLISWHVDEYPKHQRSRAWFIVMSILGIALIIYAMATANFLFAVIILMIGIITLVSLYKEPDQVDVIITNTGIIVGDAYYEYRAIRDFSIVYEPPQVKNLYVDFHTSWRPLLSVPLGDTDPNIVREHLLNFCLENLERADETLTDVIRRLYKV